MVDPWEAGQPEYQRTAVVLDHFDEMLNGKDGEGGVEMRNGGRRKYKVMLLAGGDLIESFGEPGVWSAPDVSRAAGSRGARPTLIVVFSAARHSRAIRMSDRGESGIRRMGVFAFARYSISPSVRISVSGLSVCLSVLALTTSSFRRRNVIVIKQLIYNDISSTKVRYVLQLIVTVRLCLTIGFISGCLFAEG